MKCPRCARVNGAGRHFCGACGASLEQACADCAFVNDVDDRFCGGCGGALVAAAARVVAAASTTAMLSLDDVRALLADVAARAAPAAPSLPHGAIDQDDLDRLFGGSS